MAIEPLGSVMSTQMQMNVAPKPRMVEHASDVPVQNTQVTERVDNTTMVVEGTTEKGAGNFAEQTAEQSSEQLRKAVERLNKNIGNSEAVFGIHEGTNRVTIKLVDKDTKEVIKELPPEKTLDMIAKAWELAGLLVDERR